ncbi:DUF1772 domain-containing protein [Candidatus Endowatersipora endosymbiont of Watersipora subatra]|uniref:DUF1772 domain-containing protein n=1 Tax=Candidatus Endowatersipora endosymbiont of Watersipora subatra TaxID=3077946 RepID=UPI00312C7ADE
MRLFFNIFAICGAAAFSGLMLCIGITLGNYWLSLTSQDFLDWFSKNHIFISKTIPLVVTPTIIGLFGSLWTSWHTKLKPFWLWVTSTSCIGVVIVLTAIYFVPTNHAFASGNLDLLQVNEKLNQWLLIHYIRIAFAMLSAIIGSMALALDR